MNSKRLILPDSRLTLTTTRTFWNTPSNNYWRDEDEN